MREVAREMAKYGRHGDDMLLHVSRKELEGIRALTGRNFTRNPDTGLPEAFDFADLIPIIAGVAGTMVGGPVVGALASGATTAGKAAIEGESAGDALTKGLISGVTSYAGGQLLSGVGDAAAAGAGNVVGDATGSAASNIGSNVVGEAGGATFSGATAVPAGSVGINNAGISSLTGASTPISSIAPQLNPMDGGSIAAGYTGAESALGGSGIPAKMAAPTPSFGERFSQFGQRLGNIASDPGTAASQLGSNIMARPDRAAIAAGGTALQLSDMMGGGQPQIPGLTPRDPNKYPEQFPANPRRWNAPPAGYQPGVSPEYRYFAEGGLATLRDNEGSYTANLMNETKAALLGEHPRPEYALNRFRETFGDEALIALRDRLVGGQVRGAGSGLDDLVPGTIEGRQKVRLADGEFVVPSDVVSGLGDGSTNHGVRKLHEMMNRVRQERHGSSKQPGPVGRGVMPA